jgi:hypothetical protein
MKLVLHKAILWPLVAGVAVLATGENARSHQVIVSNQYGECHFVGSGQIVFSKHGVDAAFTDPRDLCIADLDKDGFADIVSVSTDGGLVAWWESAEGTGTNWTQHVIDAGVGRPFGVDVADVDDDGFLDVLAAAYDDDRIFWWRNTDGTGTNWTEHLIALGLNSASDVIASDIDGDGDRDVVGTGPVAGRVLWWENIGGAGTNWIQRVVDNSVAGPMDLDIADMDGDGDADILCAADDLLSSSDRILWWENADGNGSNWVEHVVDAAFSGAGSVDAADCDKDGDLDIVGGTSAVNGTAPDIKWWENLDGAGGNWATHRVGDGRFSRVYDVATADVDRDGDSDILGVAREDNDVSWWENLNGDGTLWRENIITTYFNGAGAVAAADIDGDGETDVAVAATDGDAVAWWENSLDGRAVFASPTDTNEIVESATARCFVTNTPYAHGATQYVCVGWTGTGSVPPTGTVPSVGPFALTGDTVITWNWKTQYWLNVSSQSNGWVDTADGWHDRGTELTLLATPDHLHAFVRWTGEVPASSATNNPVRLPMDQARSIAAVFRAVDHIVTPSSGPNGAISPTGLVGVVTGEGAVFRMIPDIQYHVADIQIDGLSVGASNTYVFTNITNDHTIHVVFALNAYRFTVTNAAGVCHLATDLSVAFSGHRLTSPIDSPTSLRVGDIDSDGDSDLVAVALATNSASRELLWWENDGADSTNWVSHAIWTNTPGSTFAAVGDIDQDSDPDLLVVASNELHLLRNDLVPVTNWLDSLVTTNYPHIQDLVVADMNGNVIRDLVAVASPGTVVWWENMDGTGGTWFGREVATDFDGAACVRAVDVDGDGHTDIVGAATSRNEIVWWRNTRGDGSQWEQHNVTLGTNGVSLLRAADFDSDGDTDFFGVVDLRDEMAWWENLNVSGTAWRKHRIADTAFIVTDAVVTDVNNDGNPDIITPMAGYASIDWWENPGGAGLPWGRHLITNVVPGPVSIAAADLNEDGRQDFVATHSVNGHLSWWEKTSGDGVRFFPTEDATNVLYRPLAYCFLSTTVVPNGKSQTKCVGWQGSGSIPASGGGTFIGPFELGSDSSVSWRWVARHWVDVLSSSNGLATVPSDWYQQGTTLVVHAVADGGYTFAGWQGVSATQALDNPVSVQVAKPESLLCRFVAGDHLILATAEAGGAILPDGGVGVQSGSDQVFTFVADPGSVVTDVVVDNASIGPRAAYRFFSVASNHSITVSFETETALTDTDGDGLPNVEERALGMDIFLPDTDGDGFGDYEEAVAGTSGTNAASFFSVLTGLHQGGSAIVSWQTATGRVYDLWWRSSLVTGLWQQVGGQTNLPGNGALRSYTNALPGAKTFFRPSVERP